MRSDDEESSDSNSERSANIGKGEGRERTEAIHSIASTRSGVTWSDVCKGRRTREDRRLDKIVAKDKKHPRAILTL
jgi:hypothetical protein